MVKLKRSTSHGSNLEEESTNVALGPLMIDGPVMMRTSGATVSSFQLAWQIALTTVNPGGQLFI